VVLLSAALVASVVPAGPAAAGRPRPAPGLPSQAEPLDDHGGEVRGRPVTRPAPPSLSIPDPVWPAGGRARVTVTGAAARSTPAGGRVRAGALPVWVAPGPDAGSATRSVDVEVLDRAATPAGWRDGVVVRVAAGAASASSSAAAPVKGHPVRVAVDYRAFRYAYGAGWADRLVLWRLPDCARPAAPPAGCAATRLPSFNDPVAGTVSADVPLAGAGVPVELALAAAPDGASGDVSATPLAASGSWTSGGSTGDFTWSYPMRTPPSPGGPAPSIELAYSASSVDGRTQVSNNQPSWIGEGFDFWPGYIERSYVSCNQDMGGANNNTRKTGDLCWRTDNATLSLNGRSTELVFESGEGWHARQEDGSRIQKLSDAANGDDNGEHWRVTTPDGTQYLFGLDDLPGYSTATQSAWTVPVYGNHPNEPCHRDAFADSDCAQAWRWNLDRVIDPRGNTMSYWYDREHNKYAAEGEDTKDVSYVRGGTLRRIDYGTWDRSAGRSVAATGQVVFDVADRCLSDCASHTAGRWPDVPWNHECTGTECPGDYSPTFWSTQRLAKVTTRIWDTSRATPAWQTVDSWTLTHGFPPTGDGSNYAPLWLEKIVHAGHVNGTVTMPPVTFEPVSKPNRVLTRTNTTSNWHRLANIVTETGARIQITYTEPDCTEANRPADNEAHLNTRLCYPVIGPDPYDPDGPDITEWWHKYVVRAVSESDTQLEDGHQAPPELTSYTYLGAPAWHYADDDGLTRPNRKTWSQFRGYPTVLTRGGQTPGAQTLTRTDFLRGMHGDRRTPSGGTRSVTVGASLGGETVTDEDQFAGMVREQTVYNGVETKPVSKTVHVPWRSPATASRTINGDTVTANFVGDRITYTATALGVDGARGWRTTRTVSTFDNTYGTPATIQDDGDTGRSGDESCVTYTYNRNTTKHITQLPKRVTETTLPCGQAPTTTDGILGDQRLTYDGAANPDVVPAFGGVTRTEELASWTAAGGTVFQTVSQARFDDFGRRTSQTDIRGKTTTTGYAPATGPVATVTTTSPAPYNWVTTVSKAPYWGHTTRTVDQNGRAADITYDPLGRVAQVWKLGWSRAEHPGTPSEEYAYEWSADRSDYPHVRTRRLNAGGGVSVTYRIYDGRLRERQTQTAGINGNRVVSDTLHDELGNVVARYPHHLEPGAPSGTLWWEPEWSLPTVIRTGYDNAGRPTTDITLASDGVTNLVEKWRTTTRYEGDLTRVAPPLGGVATTTLTDVEGRTVELRQHTTAAGVDGAAQTTRYTYDRKNQLTKVVDPAGNEWTWRFDIRGRRIGETDPDKGATTFEYNEFDDLVKTTDARELALVYAYDDLGRKTDLYAGSVSDANRRVRWRYDTLFTGAPLRGQLTETIRYEGGQEYKRQVSTVNTRYQATGVNFVVPTTETGLGGTYTYSFGFSPYDGTGESIGFPAAGGLPAETVTTRFNGTTGLAAQLVTNAVNVGQYVLGQQYTDYGEPTVTTRQTAGGQYVQENLGYDTATRRLARVTVRPEAAAGLVVDRRYDYDAVGNVLSIVDAPEVGQGETQCFRHDALRRLVSAWTPADVAACATGPALAGLAGPAPYWTEWTFDKVGNRLTETAHAAGGDTRRSFSVPTGGVGVPRPHAVTAVTTEAPGTSPSTVTYAYDETGNTTNRPASGAGTQTLTWDVEGRLARVVDPAGTTTHVHDGDGGRLLRRDPGGTTLYLPGMEVRRPAGAGANVATRYYEFGGRAVASRSAAGGLVWLFADRQGTQQTTVKADTGVVTVRRQTPYGAPRGPQPSWPTGKGFVGGDDDPTGLVHLGAREYDAALGRFVSVDPVIDVDAPEQMHGYTYGYNSPVTFSDPTGQRPPEMDPGDWQDYVVKKQRQAQRRVGGGGHGGGSRTKVPPRVSNSRLNDILRENIYLRDRNRTGIGDGKVAAAVHNEFQTGQQTVGKWHYRKAMEAFNALSRLLENDRHARIDGRQLLSDHDLAVARAEAKELWDAVNAEDKAQVWTKDNSPAERANKEIAQRARNAATSRVAVADITGAEFDAPQFHGEREQKARKMAGGPKLRGAAKMLGVLSWPIGIYQGYRDAQHCEHDCGLELPLHIGCAMVPGCDDPHNPYGILGEPVPIA
jgi:RHS repeat-associated protein